MRKCNERFSESVTIFVGLFLTSRLPGFARVPSLPPSRPPSMPHFDTILKLYNHI